MAQTNTAVHITRRKFFQDLGRAYIKGAATLVAFSSPLLGCIYHMAIRGGKIERTEQNEYHLTAISQSDPAFMILANDLGLEGVDLTGKQFLSFEIKGKIRKESQYIRLIVQVYGAGDESFDPSVKQSIGQLSPQSYRKVTVFLLNKIDKLQKLQFVLSTDQGSCDLYVRNIRID